MLRHVAQWCDVPLEAAAALPALALESLLERITTEDRTIVQDRRRA